MQDAPPPSDAPGTAGPPEIEDMREHFSKVTKETPRDPDAERAFVEGKIEMIRSDPNLSDEEKAAAIEELRRKVNGTQNPGRVG
ncbi:MAG: hypothetical protein ABR613_11280 [Actinomycetota bacterium]